MDNTPWTADMPAKGKVVCKFLPRIMTKRWRNKSSGIKSGVDPSNSNAHNIGLYRQMAHDAAL